MLPATRLVIGVGSVLALAIGLVVLFTGSVDTVVPALWLLALGGVGLIGITFERMRYRSESAERSGEAPGAAGVDSEPPDPRFRPTDERFVDPTTRQQLRVWIDPATGERRYRLDE
jgi:hypothetical protein